MMASMGWGWGFKRRVLALTGLIAIATAFTGTLTNAASVPTSVIIRGRDASDESVRRAVSSVGGHITRRIGIINGYVASIPSGRESILSSDAAIVSVTPNARIRLLSDPLPYKAAEDTGSLYEVSRIVGAQTLWTRGFTGAGVDVALIDSGVAPVPGLDATGKIVNGPDLSFDSPAANLRYLDTFGHGTHMAGIIAGRDADAVTPYTDPARFTGIAPDARLLSVKVAAADGSTDVSQVIAAIDWVVQHKNDNGLNVRVLNLSFGTDGLQSYMLDPLAFAAEVAWRKGIVVVVSAGNGGAAATSLTDPGYDPYVIAAGADDPRGTETVADDVVAEFSSRGNSTRHADFLAPGKSVISLRVPNSYIDEHAPAGRVGTRFFRGSGTSQAAAVTSGVVALLLQQRPSLTPDQVKGILLTTAAPLRSADPVSSGAGVIDASKARTSPPQQAAPQTFAPSTGTGTLEGSRGSYHVTDNGVALTGEKDIFGQPFNTATWAPASAAGSTWSGGTWNGSTWSGSTWSGSTWSGSTWSGSTCSGSTSSGHTLSGSIWSGSTWSG
ncbi:MAG: S8 family serine peptidase, partial [Actinomycetota bacterium]